VDGRRGPFSLRFDWSRGRPFRKDKGLQPGSGSHEVVILGVRYLKARTLRSAKGERRHHG
jgi:hypothetical protein